MRIAPVVAAALRIVSFSAPTAAGGGVLPLTGGKLPVFVAGGFGGGATLAIFVADAGPKLGSFGGGGALRVVAAEGGAVLAPFTGGVLGVAAGAIPDIVFVER